MCASGSPAARNSSRRSMHRVAAHGGDGRLPALVAERARDRLARALRIEPAGIEDELHAVLRRERPQLGEHRQAVARVAGGRDPSGGPSAGSPASAPRGGPRRCTARRRARSRRAPGARNRRRSRGRRRRGPTSCGATALSCCAGIASTARRKGCWARSVPKAPVQSAPRRDRHEGLEHDGRGVARKQARLQREREVLRQAPGGGFMLGGILQPVLERGAECIVGAVLPGGGVEFRSERLDARRVPCAARAARRGT